MIDIPELAARFIVWAKHLRLILDVSINVGVFVALQALS